MKITLQQAAEFSRATNAISIGPLIPHSAVRACQPKPRPGAQDEWRNGAFLGDVLYLSILLEQFVLHDQIIVLDSADIDMDTSSIGRLGTDESTRFRKQLEICPPLAALAKAGIFKFVEDEFDIESDEHERIAEEFYTDAHDVDYYTVFEILTIRKALQCGCPFVGDHSTSVADAKRLLEVSHSQHVNLLGQEFSRINSTALRQLKELAHAGRNVQIYVPPIPAIILSRCEKMEDIGHRTMELREELSHVRTAFTAYSRAIGDDSLALGESLEALRKLKSATAASWPNSEDANIFELSEWRDFGDVAKLLDGFSGDAAASGIKFLLNQPLKLVGRSFQRRRVLGLSELRRNFLKIRNYGKLTERIFRRAITHEHLRDLNTSHAAGLAHHILG